MWASLGKGLRVLHRLRLCVCLCLRVRIAYRVMYEAGIGNVNTDLLICLSYSNICRSVLCSVELSGIMRFVSRVSFWLANPDMSCKFV